MHLKPDPESPTNSNQGSSTPNSNNNNNVNNGNAIVRVESAADEGLDELFKAVMNDGSQTRLPQQVPMRQRRLPPSFFRPPSAASSNNSLASGGHSRESSLDGGYQSGQTPTATTVNNNNNNSQNDANKVLGSPITTPVLSYNSLVNGGMSIIHPRANSSPAALQPAVLANGSLNNNGSATSVSGQAFNSNELKQAAQNNNSNNSHTGISHFRQMSYDLEQIRLPDGWEMSYTANGERYFLNHKEKTTTWEDPRKKILEEMLHRSGLQPIIPQPGTIVVPGPGPTVASTNQPTTPVTAAAATTNESYIDPSIVPLPEGWEQAQTQSGDIYFISHIDQTTTWFHPSIPRNLQMKRVQQQSCTIQLPPFQNKTPPTTNIPSELVAALKNMNTSCPTAAAVGTSPSILATTTGSATTPTPNPLMDISIKSQQNQHLRDLELERERMKQRQEELLQSSLLNNSTSSNILLSAAAAGSSSTTSTDQQSVGTPSPFLLQQQPSQCHSRQESIDSGLDLGNSSNYSIPHTPDDFLRMQTQPSSSGSGSGTVGANSNSNSTNNGTNSISDDLAFEAMQISGLDLDSESMDFMQGLDMDLLSNVEELLNSNKDNIMTWL